MSKRLMLVDGPNLAWRSIHAIRPGNSFEGATGPLVLFVRALSKYVREVGPDELVVCWEGGKSEFRTRIYSEYKANRGPSGHPLRDSAFTMIQSFLALCRISQARVRGFEADDLIAALWRTYHDRRVTILSSDKDLLQLVSDRSEQIRLGGGGADTDLWTVEDVRREFGCEPEDLPRLMAITGDRGDNVPGITGMGPKKALKALENYGWDLEENSHPAVSRHRDQVLLSHRLVNLRDPEEVPDVSQIPLEFDPVSGEEDPDFRMLGYFLLANQLQDLYNRSRQGTLWH